MKVLKNINYKSIDYTVGDHIDEEEFDRDHLVLLVANGVLGHVDTPKRTNESAKKPK